METTIQEVLSFIEENDVKFIRLAFCDLLGHQKNISIMPSQIERVFQHGISFDASAVKGFQSVDQSDLFLYPDVTTLDILPWRPSQGRVIRFFCEIRYPDGRVYEKDTRTLLKQKCDAIQAMGWRIMTGLECEFYALECCENEQIRLIDHGSYFDVFPNDQGEDLRRDICLTLESMGITPESSHHEQGPGQNEIDFHFDNALSSCDNYMTFRWIVDNVAQAHGLLANFMPKPMKEESGNGLHINLSLSKNNKNAFSLYKPELLNEFLAGVLAHIREITAFLNPCENSYERLGEFKAPMYISWSRANRSALVRIPAASESYVRLEVRSADPTCNPYLATYLLICAGMEGIKNHLPLQEESHTDLMQGSDLETLPLSLAEARKIALNSKFIQSVLDPGIVSFYLNHNTLFNG